MYKNFVLNLIVNLSWIIWQQTSTTHIFCQIPAVGLECEQYFTSSLLLIWRVSFYHKHGVGSNQFLSVNIGVIRLLSVITTTCWWCISWRASLYQMNDPPETWCISWRTTSYELMHQASLYQMNDPPETTTSRHCAFHHARPQYGRICSILERSRNETPCLTVLSLPWVLNPSRLSSVINLKWHCFYLHCI